MARRISLLTSPYDGELNALFKFRFKGLRPSSPAGSKLKIVRKKDARPTKTGMRYEQKTSMINQAKTRLTEKYQLLNFKYYENVFTTIDRLIPPAYQVANQLQKISSF